MNMFNKFLGLAICLLFSSFIFTWNGKEIILSNKANNRSISCAIRYYSEEELATNKLDLEELSNPCVFNHLFNANKYITVHRGGVHRGSSRGICFSGELNSAQMPTFETIYSKCKMNLTSRISSFDDLINLHNLWPEDPIIRTDIDCGDGLRYKWFSNYHASSLILIACEQDKDKGEKIFAIYSAAMRKIAQEEAQGKFRETTYKNGNVVGWIQIGKYPDGSPSINAWGTFNKEIESSGNLLSKFKNFVWNEKFLYTMGGLSGLYLGYQYLNQ